MATGVDISHAPALSQSQPPRGVENNVPGRNRDGQCFASGFVRSGARYLSAIELGGVVHRAV